MGVILGILLAIVVIWRLYHIGKMVISQDFIMAIAVGGLAWSGVDFICTLFNYSYMLLKRWADLRWVDLLPVIELMIPEITVWIITGILLKSYRDKRLLNQPQKNIIKRLAIIAAVISSYNYIHYDDLKLFNTSHSVIYHFDFMIIFMLPALVCWPIPRLMDTINEW